jgi:hypothetical protein
MRHFIKMMIPLHSSAMECSLLIHTGPAALSLFAPSSLKNCKIRYGRRNYAFADTFDAVFSLKRDLTSILGQTIPLLLFTGSNSLFYEMVCSKYMTEKRLMIDISAAREGFNRRDI